MGVPNVRLVKNLEGDFSESDHPMVLSEVLRLCTNK